MLNSRLKKVLMTRERHLTLLSSSLLLASACSLVPRLPHRAAPPVCSLSEDAVQAKLAAMKRGGRGGRGGRGLARARAPPQPRDEPVAEEPAAEEPAAAADVLPWSEVDDVPVWEVPPSLRMPGAPSAAAHGRHVSLESVFPDSGLAEAWDTNSELRTALRVALRDDMFRPPAHWNEKQRRFATGLDAACMVSWRMAAEEAEERQGLASFDAAFAEHGVSLSGIEFVRGLTALCGERPHGSLIDIVPLQRRVAHSWHQDSGISSFTVLLGFPPRDRYVGGGVFSSQIKLSHPLRPTSGDAHGAVVEYELFEPPPEPIPDEHVLRPGYARGREIFVSDDTTHLHSTPDRQTRECLWRFM